MRIPAKSHTQKTPGIKSNTAAITSIPVVTVKSLAQKDIYEALKAQEMGKTANVMEQQQQTGNIIEQQPLSRSIMFQHLKKQIKEEPNPMIGAGDDNQHQQQLSNANIFSQLKEEQKADNVNQRALKDVASLIGDTDDNLPTKTPFGGNTDNDIIQKPDTAKLVDNKLLKDFRERYTEENGFQSVQSADEMLNTLQNLALTNQKQIDAHQANGDFYKDALTSKRQDMEIASGSNKRHEIANGRSGNLLQEQQNGSSMVAGIETQILSSSAGKQMNSNLNQEIQNDFSSITRQHISADPYVAWTSPNLAWTNYPWNQQNTINQQTVTNQHPVTPKQSLPATYRKKLLHRTKKHGKKKKKENNRHLKIRKHKLKTFSIHDGPKKETVSYFVNGDGKTPKTRDKIPNGKKYDDLPVTR